MKDEIIDTCTLDDLKEFIEYFKPTLKKFFTPSFSIVNEVVFIINQKFYI